MDALKMPPGTPVFGTALSHALSEDALQEVTPDVAETVTSWPAEITEPPAVAVNPSVPLLTETVPAPVQAAMVKGVTVCTPGRKRGAASVEACSVTAGGAKSPIREAVPRLGWGDAE